MLIRVWTRTAVRKEVTSIGTFLSTLCHEFCHHLDFQRFGFADSWHTRGFYERTAALSPPCAGDAAEAAVLGSSAGRAMADRLAADESERVRVRLRLTTYRSVSLRRRP